MEFGGAKRGGTEQDVSERDWGTRGESPKDDCCVRGGPISGCMRPSAEARSADDSREKSFSVVDLRLVVCCCFSFIAGSVWSVPGTRASSNERSCRRSPKT